MTRQDQINAWWDSKKTIYPYHAETNSDELDPKAADHSKLFGDFISCVLKEGTRTWGFLTPEDRATFIKHTNAKEI